VGGADGQFLGWDVERTGDALLPSVLSLANVKKGERLVGLQEAGFFSAARCGRTLVAESGKAEFWHSVLRTSAWLTLPTT
jgi:hypothetical protein